MTLLTTPIAAVATGSTDVLSQGEIFLIKAVALAWMFPVSFIGYLFFRDALGVLLRGWRRTGDVVIDVVCPVVGTAFAATYVALGLYILFLDAAGINKLLGNHFSNNASVVVNTVRGTSLDSERSSYRHDSARSSGVSQNEDKNNVLGFSLHTSPQKITQRVLIVWNEGYRTRRFNDHSVCLGNATALSIEPRKPRVEEAKPSFIWVAIVGFEALKGSMGQWPVSAPFKQVAAQIHHGFVAGIEENESMRVVPIVVFNCRFGFGKEASKKQNDVGVLGQLTFFFHKDKLLSSLTSQIKRSAGHGDIRESNHVIGFAVHKKILATETSMRGSAFGAGVVV